MTRPLDGRVAIVTGAGRGVGRAIAAELAAAGTRVVIADSGTSRDGEGMDPSVAAAAAAALGDSAVPFTDSIASPGVAQALIEHAVRTFGSLDIVVSAAGIRRHDPIFEAKPMDWDAVTRNNLSAPFYLANAAAAWLRRRGKAGRIVNIVSAAAVTGEPGHAADAGAAAGVVGLTRAIARDLADAAITANAIAPFARTDAGRVARLVTALCLQPAASVTGQFFVVRSPSLLLVGRPKPVAKLEGSTAPVSLAEAIALAITTGPRT